MSDAETKLSRRKILAGAGVAAGTLAMASETAQGAAGVSVNETLLADIQVMLDKQACTEVMMTYCRALDRLDEDLLRSVFHPGSRHAHGYIGPSSTTDGSPDFVSYALATLRTFTRSHHQLGNIFIEVDGDVAFTEAYFTAYSRMRVQGDPLASDDAFDTEMDRLVAGRYLDRMERRDGVWKITNRTGLLDWQRIEAPASKGMATMAAEMQGKQSTEDLVFHRREQYKPGR